MKKFAVLVIALIACVGLGSLATAAPNKKDYRSEVTIKKNSADAPYNQYSEGFTGKVKSNRKCRAQRRVKIFRKGSGKVGGDKTNSSGRYAVAVSGQYAEGGRYYAKVLRKGLRGPRDCKAARSETIRVSG